jgi:AcrR family transcriptional regulator
MIAYPNTVSDVLVSKSHILEEAWILCKRDGVENTTMENIAKAAGVSYGTLVSNFERKSVLLIDLAGKIWKQINANYLPSFLNERFKIMNGKDSLRFLLDPYVQIFKEHPEYFVFFNELERVLRPEDLSDFDKMVYELGLQSIRPMMNSIYTKGMEDGSFRSNLSREAFMQSFSIVLMVSFQKLLSQSRMFKNKAESTEYLNQCAQELSDLIYYGMIQE